LILFKIILSSLLADTTAFVEKSSSEKILSRFGMNDFSTWMKLLLHKGEEIFVGRSAATSKSRLSTASSGEIDLSEKICCEIKFKSPITFT
jgi:hypothetical protein